MKELKNSFDKEISFTNLEKAKKFYIPTEEIPCDEDEYLGENYKEHCNKWIEYRKELEESETLEELAEVLTRYSDLFDNGSEYFVREF